MRAESDSRIFSRVVRITLLITGLVLAGTAVPAQVSPADAAGSGTALLEAGKYQEARGVFEAALRADPADKQAQEGEVESSEHLALQQRAGGHVVQALQALLQGEKYVPNSARLLYDQGILEDEMHLYPQALKALDSAQQLHMRNPMLLYAMARVDLDEGQLDPAATKMTAYLQLRPDDASAHYGLGRIYQLGLQFAKALAEFEESIRLDPNQTESWFQLGDVELKQDHFDAALADFRKTLARNPKHGGALTESGEVFYQEKKYQQALPLLEQAVAAAPDYQPAHYYLGLTLARLGRSADANKELATAVKLANENNKRESRQYQLILPPGSQ
ncbi:MAG TPA: tetratricopeptide repeat protein [Acidobacteriaceae bacterium]|nr:tetratricopeptide repeat protein [Acidobacteriaceae bacterium]